MIYETADLKMTGLVLGAALLAGHLYALLNRAPLQDMLKAFPRHRTVGVVLMTINALWAYWVVSSMDLGEFSGLRGKILIALPIAYVLVVFFVEEFLAVRALGTFFLLLACYVLDAAWFKFPETMPASKLLLPIMAYVWIVLGMFWVGMPYLMRDQISWVSGETSRWKALCVGGIAYGALTLGCALAFY